MDGSEFKARLKAQGLSQEDLAEHLGKDRSAVARILNGQTAMRVEIARSIEAFLALHEKPGVRERAAPFEGRAKPKLSPEELERVIREIGELGAILRNATPVSDLTDDEILGYDEYP